MFRTHVRSLIVIVTVLAVAAACNPIARHAKRAADAPVPTDPSMPAPGPMPATETVIDTAPTVARALPPAVVQRAQGDVVRRGVTPGAAPEAVGDITLNFEAASVQDVVKLILGDMLKENYVIDPAVTGTVTIHTLRPLTQAQLLPTLETLLQVNGAALLREPSGYRVVPLSTAAASAMPAQTSRSRVAGFRTQVVPLRYIGALEAEKLLAPFITSEVALKTVPERNLIVLAGSDVDLQGILDTIDVFDVDWLQGMSVGLFPIANAEAKTLVGELQAVFAVEPEAKDGVLRMVAIERLNSVLVVTPQPAYLDRVQAWIRELDRADDNVTQRIYVYRVQNGKAADLAAVLGGIFGADAAAQTPARPQLAPGSTPLQIESRRNQAGAGAGRPSVTGNPNSARAGTTGVRPAPTAARSGSAGSGITVADAGPMRIIADEVNNALVVMATPQEYELVQAALRSLDVTPLQVLIEASIVEVTLTDELSYGLEWFFKTQGIGSNTGGRGQLDLGAAGLGALAPGFSYTLVEGATDVRAVLNALATQSKVNVLSAPSLMVLDNQTATINVGDEVPIPVRQSQSVINPDSPTVNEIQYRSTGVLLSVTPRVNASGLVTMDIAQEVSDVANTTTSGLDAPTINQRAIQSTVAVQSGDTIVLGGLIRDNVTDSGSGVPLLSSIPVIGKLFGSTTQNVRRTELLVLITPRAVRNRAESVQVTDELRRKLRGLQ